MIVQRYGPGWIEGDLFAFSLELPRILCSAWIHVSNANMLCQLAGRLGHRPAPEIVRRTDDCEAEARLYFHRHHAFAEAFPKAHPRSEEHTSELQSLRHLVCRLLLEKKNK